MTNKHLIFFLIWIALFTLAGCATTQVATPVEVKIPVPVLCTTQTPTPPEPISCYKDTQNIFEAVQCLLYERKINQAYRLELETALESCK